MSEICRQCGKEFHVLYPSLWGYKRGTPSCPIYLCSYSCLRAFDKEKKEQEGDKQVKVSPEQKKKAVELAINGGDPLKYLEEIGSTYAPSLWYLIKKDLKAKDPETYEKLPAKYKPVAKKEKNPVETPETPAVSSEYVKNAIMEIPQVKVDGALKIETNEPKKIEVVTEQKPLKPGLRGLNNSDFTVSAIKHPQLGEFYYDQKFNSVDWRSPEGEEISLHPAMWKELYMIIPDVMGILGVPDYE